MIARSTTRVVVAFVLVLVAGTASPEDDDRPSQVRDPQAFWQRKVVFQKLGIVIEDEDYIVRERYWVLDKSVTGSVTDVDVMADSTAVVEVRFDGRDRGWRQHGVNIRDRRVSRTNRTVNIRPEPYGDGLRVDADEVTFSYRIEGEEVDPARCGVIVRLEGDVTVVRFPCHLAALAAPRKGDVVMRSADWHDGFADGGTKPTGPLEQSSVACVGTVEGERDEDGFVAVRWHKTGRKKSHRFDHHGYYDIELVPR